MSVIENVEEQSIGSGLLAKLSDWSRLLLASLKAQFILFMIAGLYILTIHLLTSNTPGLQPYEISFSFFLIIIPVLLLSVIIYALLIYASTSDPHIRSRYSIRK